MLLAHELVDLVVEVADLEVAQAGLLDFGYLARNLLEHLAPPFLTHGDRGDGRDGFGTARPRDIEDAQRGSLLSSKSKQHRLRFFRVARLYAFLVSKRRRGWGERLAWGNWWWEQEQRQAGRDEDGEGEAGVGGQKWRDFGRVRTIVAA